MVVQAARSDRHGLHAASVQRPRHDWREVLAP